MVYRILKQFIPGNDNLWVAKLNASDTVFEYDTLEEAETKLSELQENDSEGRSYKISQIG